MRSFIQGSNAYRHWLTMTCFVLLAGTQLATAASTVPLPKPESPAPPDYPLVRTLAGSGAVGFQDGIGDAATFVAPSGIAYDRSGNLIVADRDGQRIRMVSRAGVVTTIAGGATMIPLGIAAFDGYRDGPASQALFDMPSAVLPLPDGSILIADSNNHCLRLLKDGMVSTYSGKREVGFVDGTLANARYDRPMSLARDTTGNVYIADPPNGVRKIDTRGIVSTLNFPESRSVITLSAEPKSDTFIMAASVKLVQEVNTQTLDVYRQFPLEFGYMYQSNPGGTYIRRENLTNAGPVSAIAAFSSGAFVFTDALNSAVRFAQTTYDRSDGSLDNYTRTLSAVPPESAAIGFGGFKDGPGDAALFDEPGGIAISPDGDIAVADTGNRRIRILSQFNKLTHLSSAEANVELPTEPNAHEYRIAIVGNSYVWWNQAWHESLAGMTEDALNSVPHGPRHVRVVPIMRLGACSPSTLGLIDGELARGTVDMVVFNITTFGQLDGDGFAGTCFSDRWEVDLKKHLLATMNGLKAEGIKFLVINFPGASDFPDELAYFRLPKSPGVAVGSQNDPSDVQSFHDKIAAVLADAGAPTLDLWPAFITSYDGSDRVPLYGSWDHHLTLAGRRIVVTQLTKRILQDGVLPTTP